MFVTSLSRCMTSCKHHGLVRVPVRYFTFFVKVVVVIVVVVAKQINDVIAFYDVMKIM